MKKVIICKNNNLQYLIKLPDKKQLIKSFLDVGFYTPNATQFKECVDMQKIGNILRSLYTISYNKKKHFQSKIKYTNSSVQEAYDEYLNNPQFMPQNLSNKEIINLGSTIDNHGLGNKLGNPNAQNFIPFWIQDCDYDYLVGKDENGNSLGFSSTFIHVFGHRAKMGDIEPVQVRLYLNLPTQHLTSFITEFWNKCNKLEASTKEKLYPYFKFSNAGRLDQFILYTSYANTAKYISVFEEIKQEHPEYCVGSNVMDQNLGNINNWIGFGECTRQDYIESYSSLRDYAVSQFISEIKNNPEIYGDIKTIKATNPKIIKLFDDILIKNDIDPETYVLNTDSKLKDFVVTLNKVNSNTTTENSEENN